MSNFVNHKQHLQESALGLVNMEPLIVFVEVALQNVLLQRVNIVLSLQDNAKRYVQAKQMTVCVELIRFIVRVTNIVIPINVYLFVKIIKTNASVEWIKLNVLQIISVFKLQQLLEIASQFALMLQEIAVYVDYQNVVLPLTALKTREPASLLALQVPVIVFVELIK